MVSNKPKIFTPLTLGGEKNPVQLQHRVVMAPLTRLRAGEEGVQPAVAAEYYAQRSTPGGLLVTEATNISLQARGYYGAPGIFTYAQVESWKVVTSAVHAKGGKIFLQLWHVGRVSHPLNQPNEQVPVCPSATPFNETRTKSHSVTREGRKYYVTPRALDLDEIPGIIEDYRQAALNSIEAGFDGVELHSANGYLLEQFLCDNINTRTDKYGGSIENRARLIFEVVDAITSVVPTSQVGIRLSPYGMTFGCMDSNPSETYGYVVNKLNDYNLSYLHVVEPRGKWHYTSDLVPEGGATGIYRKIFKGPLITCSDYNRDMALTAVEEGVADMVAFGRDFIATPDLVKRLELNVELNPIDYPTFYFANGDPKEIAKGYTDYPFYSASA